MTSLVVVFMLSRYLYCMASSAVSRIIAEDQLRQSWKSCVGSLNSVVRISTIIIWPSFWRSCGMTWMSYHHAISGGIDSTGLASLFTLNPESKNSSISWCSRWPWPLNILKWWLATGNSHIMQGLADGIGAKREACEGARITGFVGFFWQWTRKRWERFGIKHSDKKLVFVQ